MRNVAICIKIDEFCIKLMNFVLKMMDFALMMMDFVKVDNSAGWSTLEHVIYC